MQIPSIKKGAWWLLIGILVITTIASIMLVSPYRNEYKTTVEPLQFNGTYQLGSDTAPKPLSSDTYIDACVYDSVIFHGAFAQQLQKDAQILFYVKYLEVHIFLNDDEIYTWGTEGSYPAFMRSAGAAWGHCEIPADLLPTDEITIVLKNSYANNYNSAYHDFLDSMKIGDSGALARAIFELNWPQLLIGLILFLIGITLLLFVLLLIHQKVTIHPSVLYCALFALSCGLWTVISPVYSTLLMDNASLIMLLETILMWLISMFLFGYFGTFMQTRVKRINNLLVFGFAFTLAVFLFLQLLGITDAYAVRDFYIIVVAVCVVVFVCIFQYEFRHGEKLDMRTLMPIGVLYIIFGMIEILNYQFEWFARGIALTLGLSLFISVQLALAVRQIRDSLLMSMKAISLEKDLVESRTAVMLSQIQPHFLYNSLVGIKELCDTGEQQITSQALEHFAYYLRGNLDSLSGKKLISFSQEVSHVKDYLFLEKMRFEEKLHIVWDLQFIDFRLPSLTLQPIVENAVHHGITGKKHGGTLIIRSEKTGDTVIITVIDDGLGFDTSKSPDDGRTHIGIGNVRKRLGVQCGGLLQIESMPGVGTTVKIILPGTKLPYSEIHRSKP